MGVESSRQRGDCLASARSAVCVLEPRNGISGVIRFHQCSIEHPVCVEFDLRGPPRQTHAIHIHEYGDIRKGCESLGAHYNPYSTLHGSGIVPRTSRHAGDLINNVRFDQNGVFILRYTDTLLCLYRGGGIYGRSVVIHADPDDLGRGGNPESLVTGNAGKRIQCGVIALCKSEHFKNDRFIND